MRVVQSIHKCAIIVNIYRNDRFTKNIIAKKEKSCHTKISVKATEQKFLNFFLIKI